MASPADVPGLEDLAYRVPEDVRADMSEAELRIRLQYVLDLRARADAASNETRAANLRRRADKALAAVSPSVYAAAQARLDGEMADARLNGETHRAMAALEEMHRLERNHPQPPAEFYRNALQAVLIGEVDRVAATLPPIPPAESKNAFTRRFNRKSRKR